MPMYCIFPHDVLFVANSPPTTPGTLVVLFLCGPASRLHRHETESLDDDPTRPPCWAGLWINSYECSGMRFSSVKMLNKSSAAAWELGGWGAEDRWEAEPQAQVGLFGKGGEGVRAVDSSVTRSLLLEEGTRRWTLEPLRGVACLVLSGLGLGSKAGLGLGLKGLGLVEFQARARLGPKPGLARRKPPRRH
ncbi:hypothetical protein JB92DRAFT_3099609 [Gautieria morchelliformis]|nr:hypothetical protein JB92DRAFT_3099609 [Gautieria morchelliformis]